MQGPVQLELGFRAETGGTYRMTWGQHAIWQPIKWYGDASSFFNIPMVVDLPGDPAPPDRDAVIAAMCQLVERHQSLRAHFFDGPDGPTQRIAADGKFSVQLHQDPPGGSRAHADAVAAGLAAGCFDHEAEWPVRMAVVCAGGVARHAVFVVSHLAADGGGFQALIADFLNLLRPAGGVPASHWQPIDQVLREQSKRGLRRNRASVDYWRRQLTRIPPSMFGFAPGPAAQPRFRQIRLDSRAMAAAAVKLAADQQVSLPSAVLSGAALALATLCGQTTSVLQLIVGNRYDDQVRTLVGAAAQDGLLVVDYPGGTLAEAVRATHQAARAGYFYGYYDPAAVDELRTEVAAQRGIQFDLTTYFNDLTPLLGGAAGPDGSNGQDSAGLPEPAARRLRAESQIVPEAEWDTQDCKFFLEAECGTDISRLHLLCDTAYVPGPTMETVLRGMETILLEAAYGDATVADIPALTGIRPAGPPAPDQPVPPAASSPGRS